jgi:hypothetical protein
VDNSPLLITSTTRLWICRPDGKPFGFTTGLGQRCALPTYPQPYYDKNFFSLFQKWKEAKPGEAASAGHQCHGKRVRKHDRRITATILPATTRALPRAILIPSRPYQTLRGGNGLWLFPETRPRCRRPFAESERGELQLASRSRRREMASRLRVSEAFRRPSAVMPLQLTAGACSPLRARPRAVPRRPHTVPPLEALP